MPAMSFDPCVLHTDPFAKYAAAFPRVSCSIFTRASAARSGAISICSADTYLPAPSSFPVSSVLIHAFSIYVLMTGIFAVAASLWPLRTMHTAPILNSSMYRALGLPIVKSSFTEVLHILINGYAFRGQGQFTAGSSTLSYTSYMGM